MPNKEPNPKLYYYKMTTDNGGAPCVKSRMLSLAICKPSIRSTAQVGDIIFGFGSKTLEPEAPNCRLIYIAEVTEKLCDGRYYRDSQYVGRDDCIYAFDEQQKIYQWREGALHHSPEAIEHDVGKHTDGYPKANVLLSRNFKYFGGTHTPQYESEFPVVYDAVNIITQGHRVNHEPDLREELIRLKNKVWGEYSKSSKLGKPSSEPSRSVCHYNSPQEGSC